MSVSKAEREELRLRIESAFFRVVGNKPTMRIPAERDDVDVVLADCTKILDAFDAAEAKIDRMRDYLIGRVTCPCCQQTEKCVADCTFAEDCREASEEMRLARLALHGEPQ